MTVGVLANDTDVDGDSLTVTGATNGTHGTTAANANNTITYTPAANYFGPDTFTYTISDGHGGSASGTVSVNVQAVNDAPVAVTDNVTVSENGQITIPVVANDTDVDGDAITLTSVGAASHGSIVQNGNNVTYTPALTYSGTDSFVYSISDGHGGTASGVVNVTVSAISSNAALTGVLNSINPVIDASTNKTDQGKLGDAAKKLGDALNQSQWLDGDHLDARRVTRLSTG